MDQSQLSDQHLITLSAIIPVYNGEKYVENAINSILNQRNHKFNFIEIIIINDGSTDSSVEIINKLAKKNLNIVLLNLNKNKGVAHARNLGVKRAKGEWLAFLDQDDQWDINKLSLQYDFIVKKSNYNFVLAMQSFILEGNNKKPGWVKSSWLESSQAGFVFGCLLIRKCDFINVGYLDENLNSGVDDVQWFSIAKNKNFKFKILDKVLLYRSIHENNFSSNTQLANIELLKLIRNKINKSV